MGQLELVLGRNGRRGDEGNCKPTAAILTARAGVGGWKEKRRETQREEKKREGGVVLR